MDNNTDGEALSMMPWWWNNWDKVVVTGALMAWAVYCTTRITNDVRSIREMTEEIVKYTRWRATDGRGQ